MRRIGAAIAANNVNRMDVNLVVVPTDLGAAPPHWPAAGLTRTWLRDSTGAQLDALLGDYGQPINGTVKVRRSRLAAHIGAPPM